ncbi:MAG: protein-glutamate O-methyltransferase CheR [Candidatus Bathyarchaeota archaeon]|nr:protein-glutamate O-methyltransferase CheR [Candidatus Bathyarchaeota archaeon]
MAVSVSDKNFMEDVAFERLRKVMNEGTGINFQCYRESYLKRRLKVRMMVTKQQTYSEYTRYLLSTPEEFNLLVNDLTINFTKFFRDTDVYDYLKGTLLPELLSSQKSWLRIWSAGCATGEEPYSLAMLMHEVAKHGFGNCRITIFASDLDKNALAKAKAGEYSTRMVQGVDEGLLKKYFDFEDGVYKVKPFVKQLIQFEEADLMVTPKHENLDLILCRNVMIYFSKEIQNTIYAHFHDSLKSDGYLITGKTEFVGMGVNKKFVDINPKCRVYKKA